MSARPTWDEYFGMFAMIAAARATCPRASVGAVLVKDNRIIATGYNGAPENEPHCIDEGVGCLMEDGHCQRALHAEINAMTHASKDVRGSTLYLWSNAPQGQQPCRECRKVMNAAGVRFYLDPTS